MYIAYGLGLLTFLSIFLFTLAAKQVYSGWAGQILHTAKADQWPVPQEPQRSAGSVPRGVPVVWKREEESSSW